MSPDNQPDPLAAMDPADGYRVVAQAYGDAAWLELRLYVGGEPVGGLRSDAATVVATWSDYAGPVDRGDVARLKAVLDAVARYLNTGGEWERLTAALAVVRSVAPPRHLGPYFYYDGATGEDGYCHVFVRRDGLGGLRWVERCYVDPLSAADLLEEFGDVRVARPDAAGGELSPGPGLPGPQ